MVSLASMPDLSPVLKRAALPLASIDRYMKQTFNLRSVGGIGPVVALLVASAVSNLLMLTGPLFMLQVYDRVLSSRSIPTLLVLTGLVCAIYAFYAFIETVRSRMAIRFANLIYGSLRDKLFSAAVRSRLMSETSAYSDPVRDGDTLRSFLTSPAPMALLDLPWTPFYLALVFMFHPLLGWLAIGGGLVVAALMVVSELVLRKPSSDGHAAAALRQRRTDDSRNNAETIVAMGMLGDMTRRWSEGTSMMIGVQRTAGDHAVLFSSVTKAFRFLLQSLILALGAYLVIQGSMTGGLMIAASVITSRALAPVEQTIAHWRSFVSVRQALGRVRKVLSGNPEKRVLELPLPEKSLSVAQLVSGPPGSGTATVGGVRFTLEAGDGLGVLGLSGSGKSSLSKALVGVWPLLAGEVRLDGAMLRHYDPAQIGRIIGYLPQRVELFDGTIAENIARFRLDATSEDVLAAAKAAQIHELINNLPNGYETHVSPNGDNISAGQRQRIGLARALFGNPFLIVLDEPNSNLDAAGDAALSAAIHQVRGRGGIVVIVAHRPSAIVAVNKLLFIQDGRQTAFGNKADVLRQVTGDNVRPLKVSEQ